MKGQEMAYAGSNIIHFISEHQNFGTTKGSTHKVQVNPGRSLFDWAMKPFALRRLGHHIV